MPPPRLELLLGVLLISTTMRSTAAFPEYQDELPNLPTVDGSPWPGVGHLNRGGGGLRNPFGQDFAAAGYAWTQALCQRDSDGDGHSNGQELGDPACKVRGHGCASVRGGPRPLDGREGSCWS